MNRSRRLERHFYSFSLNKRRKTYVRVSVRKCVCVCDISEDAFGVAALCYKSFAKAPE